MPNLKKWEFLIIGFLIGIVLTALAFPPKTKSRQAVGKIETKTDYNFLKQEVNKWNVQTVIEYAQTAEQELMPVKETISIIGLKKKNISYTRGAFLALNKNFPNPLKPQKQKQLKIKPGKSNWDIEQERLAKKRALTEMKEQEKQLVQRNGALPDWKWQIVDIVKQYDWDWRVATAIFMSESGLNPTAVGDRTLHPRGSCGITQLYKCPLENWQDPKTNIDYAYWNKYRVGGWRHWTDYKNGKYRQYLWIFN